MDEPREKDIKVIRQKPNLLQGFPIEYFKGNPPPQNDSSKVKIELRKLSDLPHDIDFVKEMDALTKYLKTTAYTRIRFSPILGRPTIR